MSKTYIVSRNGGTVTKAPINDNKIPIYANETALDADLANIPDNTLVATRGGHDDVIDQMKAYIRDQNELSDWESITLSTDSNNPTVMQYDGVVNLWSELNAQNQAFFYVYANGQLVQRSASSAFTNISVGEVIVKKGDEVYLTGTATPFASVARFYKKRDYSNRQ